MASRFRKRLSHARRTLRLEKFEARRLLAVTDLLPSNLDTVEENNVTVAEVGGGTTVELTVSLSEASDLVAAVSLSFINSDDRLEFGNSASLANGVSFLGETDPPFFGGVTANAFAAVDHLPVFRIDVNVPNAAGDYRVTLDADVNDDPLRPTNIRLDDGTDDPITDFGDLILRVPSPPVPIYSIQSSDADKNEGNAGSTDFTFQVTRAGDTSQAGSVNFAVAPAGPVDGQDFVGGLPTGTVHFAAGETTQTISLDVQGDTDVEDDETFTVTLSDASGNGTLGDSNASGVIRNDDAQPVPVLSIATADGTKAEGSGGETDFLFTVSRSGSTAAATSVEFFVAADGNLDAGDFVGGLPSGVVNFEVGETSQTITVVVDADTEVESDEAFVVTLRNPTAGAILQQATASGLIQNDDVAPSQLSISATDANRNEGDEGTNNFTFTVSRSGNLSGTSTADFAVTATGSNAASASDFQSQGLPSGQVTFSPGQSSQVVTIPVRGDNEFEPDETFSVMLSNPTASTQITTATAEGVIVNDDAQAAPTLTIRATNGDRQEGDDGFTPFTFEVSRSQPSAVGSTVELNVSGSGFNAADADDFGGAFPSRVVSFAPNQTSQLVTINVTADTLVEADESFEVSLSNPSDNAVIAAGSAVGFIRDDDAGDASGTRILTPSTISRPHVIPGDGVPTAILLQAVEATTLTITPIGVASLQENVQVRDESLNTISRYDNGTAAANLEAGRLYAILFEPLNQDRLYSIRSSTGSDAFFSAARTNLLQRTDVDANGQTSARDALLVINEISAAKAADEMPLNTSLFADVTLDGQVSAIDALVVINDLNRISNAQAGQAEQVIAPAAFQVSQLDGPPRPDSQLVSSVSLHQSTGTKRQSFGSADALQSAATELSFATKIDGAMAETEAWAPLTEQALTADFKPE